MPARETNNEVLTPELEAIATAAAERLRAQATGDPHEDGALQQAVVHSAGAALAAGLPLAAIAGAEQVGQARARRELGNDLLRRVERAARRKREAERELEDTVIRAAGLGLPHRDIAGAADVAHGTVRAIIARATPDNGDTQVSTADSATNAVAPEL